MSISSIRSFVAPNLVEIDLSFNKLTAIPSAISNLPSLEILNLAGNQINQLNAELLKKMGSVRELSLSGNQLTSLPAQIGYLTDIEILFLQNNMIRDLPDEVRNLKKKKCARF